MGCLSGRLWKVANLNVQSAHLIRIGKQNTILEHLSSNLLEKQKPLKRFTVLNFIVIGLYLFYGYCNLSWNIIPLETFFQSLWAASVSGFSGQLSCDLQVESATTVELGANARWSTSLRAGNIVQQFQ